MRIRSPDVTYDLVPLADRLRYLRAFRIVAAALVLAAALLLPGTGGATAGLVAALVGWLGLMAAADVAWHVAPGRALGLFALMVVADGIALVWLTYGVLDEAEPLRLLLLLQVVAVSLLASYRTGLKLAIWQSLLLLCVYHGREAGILPGSAELGDAQYLDLIATMVALWLGAVATSAFSAANERELRRRRYDLEALGRLSLELERRGDPPSVAARVCEAAAEDFGFARVAIFGVRERDFEILHVHGDDAAALPDSVDFAAAETLQRAITRRRPLLVTGLREGDDGALDVVLHGARNVALVPMRAEGRTVGILACEHGLRAGSRIERRVLSMLERYASHASLALSNAWLIGELEGAARVDALTGVANRRVFDAELARELGRASRSDEPVSLLLLDIDHFKRLNDTLGHVAGDVALTALAAALRGAVRLGDTLARYGGEEFALILPGLDETDAAAAAERLRLLARDLGLDAAITVSIGVATAPDAGRDPMSLLAAADRALYAAKAAGRDAVVRHSAQAVDAPTR